MQLHAWRKERLVLGTWGDHVTCARKDRTLVNDQVENSETYGRAFLRSRAR